MMDESFGRSFEQGNRTMPIVRKILGMVFFQIANYEEDTHHNTDLYYESPYGPIRVSVRVRPYKAFKEEYKYEFTLCAHRNSGNDAEFQKIMGTNKEHTEYGHYLVYGFEDESGTNLKHWFVGDLSEFRPWMRKVKFRRTSKDNPNIGDMLMNGEVVGQCKPVRRTDRITGEMYFDYMYVFDRRAIPEFVIASSEQTEYLV